MQTPLTHSLVFSQIPTYADIREPVFLWDWILISLIASGILLLAIILYFFTRKKKTPTVSTDIERPEPSLVALNELRSLREKALQLEAEPFTVKITSIVRRYLEDALSIPAPELTTEEFLEQVASNQNKNLQIQPLMGSFLQQCDLVKFARQDLAGESRNTLINQAENLITSTSQKDTQLKKEASK